MHDPVLASVSLSSSNSLAKTGPTKFNVGCARYLSVHRHRHPFQWQLLLSADAPKAAAVFSSVSLQTQDGFTYERSAIEEWLHKSGRSPMSGAPMGGGELQPNLLVRQLIAAIYQD